MSKQLIMITAPFNCGYCETAKKDLPSICEKNGFEKIDQHDQERQNYRFEDDLCCNGICCSEKTSLITDNLV